jgi:hypothetical protein
MSTIAETTTYKGHEIEVHYDEHPESPREWDNICVFHIGHRRYAFGDKNYNDFESMEEAKREAKRNGDIVLPLYMYDHSGVTISLSPFSCPWDSGQVGFVQIPRKNMLEEFSAKIFHKKLKERAMSIAKGETETLDSYIRGEVFGYVVDDHADSCWGYYSVEDAMAEAKSIVDWMVKEAKEKHCEQLKTWIKNKVPFYARKSFAESLEV